MPKSCNAIFAAVIVGLALAAPQADAGGNGDRIPVLEILPEKLPLGVQSTGSIKPKTGTRKSHSGSILIFPLVERVHLFRLGEVEITKMSLKGWQRVEGGFMKALSTGHIITITGTSDPSDFRQRSGWKEPSNCASIMRIDFSIYRKQARLSLARACDFVVKIFGVVRAANFAAEGKILFRAKVNHPFRTLFVTISRGSHIDANRYPR